jgi:hypothetical protein
MIQAWIKKNSMFVCTVAIVSLTILLLGLPFTEWWFTGDDFHGIFLGYKTKTWSDLFYFFNDGHTNQGVGTPGGYVLERPSFLGVYYRPLYCIYLALQFWFFDTNGYGYFLCNVTAHAIAAGLLFYLIAQYSSRWTALLGSLLFAMHPQIAYRFGAIVNFHYYINVVLILCITLCLRRYLLSNCKWWLSSSLFLCATSLLTRESSLVLPGIIMLIISANAYATQKAIPWRKIFTLGILFTCIGIAFLGLRLYLYPLKHVGASSTLLPYLVTGNFIELKFQEFLVFFYDLLFLSWLPWGNKILKLGIMLPLLSLLSFAFIRCQQKLLTITFFICGLIMLWPGIISIYSPRYIYESMPYFIVGYVALFATSNLPGSFKKLLKYAASGGVTLLIIFTIYSFKQREIKLHTMHKATVKLCNYSQLSNRPLCFLTMASDGGWSGQMMWILLNNRNHQLFFESSLALTQKDSNIVKPGRWYNAIAPYYDQNFVNISPTVDGFECTSLNTSKIVFESYNDARPHKIGTIELLERTGSGAISKLSIHIDNQIWALKPLFISWNYETKSFDVMDRFAPTAT